MTKEKLEECKASGRETAMTAIAEKLLERGVQPSVFASANAEGGDEKNAAYLAKYSPRIKML